MILNNYWKYLNAILTISPWAGSNDTNIGMTDLGGGEAWIDLGTDENRGSVNRNFNNGSVVVGSGDTEPAASDYCMANDCTSSISNLNYTINSSGTAGLQRTITISGTNNTSGSITIKEAGYVKNLRTYNNHGSEESIYNAALMCRVLLDTPIIVNAGDSFLINITWDEM